MGNAIGIAITGLNSASLRLNASASNIANMQSTGSLTNKDHPAYQALTTQSTAMGNSGGVSTQIINKDPATTIAFDPTSFYADENGMVSAPYVNIEEELVTMKMAEAAYKANAQTIKTTGEMFDTLIDAMKDE